MPTCKTKAFPCQVPELKLSHLKMNRYDVTRYANSKIFEISFIPLLPDIPTIGTAVSPNKQRYKWTCNLCCYLDMQNSKSMKSFMKTNIHATTFASASYWSPSVVTANLLTTTNRLFLLVPYICQSWPACRGNDLGSEYQPTRAHTSHY